MPHSRPRPILKPLPCPVMTSTSPLPFSSSTHVYPQDSPHVHFPPTPTMTQTAITHSAFMYDRKPITVIPNTCALPERGEREVNLVSPIGSDNGDAKTWLGRCTAQSKLKGGYFHPSAYEAAEYEAQEPSSSPLLFDQEGSLPSTPAQQYTPSSSFFKRRGESPARKPLSTPHSRLVPPPLVFDSSESSDCSELGSPPEIPNQPNFSVAFTHPYHFAQHIPNVDLNFLSPLETSPRFKRRPTNDRKTSESDRENTGIRSPKEGKTKPRTRNCSTSPLERTKRAAANVACVGFSTSFSDPALEGCLGGF